MPVGVRGFLMRQMLLLLLIALCAACLALNCCGKEVTAQNVSEKSRVFVVGYMQDSRILQTQTGYKGAKLVSGSSGSGIATKTVDSYVYSDSSMDELYYKTTTEFDYQPYTEPLTFTQSDLRNVLCAKNYEVGSVYSERYTNLTDLIKDTNIYQDDNVSIYDIDSEVRGVATIGSMVRKGPKTQASYFMTGKYVGYSDLRFEIQAGDLSILYLPCP
jgi:hypothetical protein